MGVRSVDMQLSIGLERTRHVFLRAGTDDERLEIAIGIAKREILEH